MARDVSLHPLQSLDILIPVSKFTHLPRPSYDRISLAQAETLGKMDLIPFQNTKNCYNFTDNDPAATPPRMVAVPINNVDNSFNITFNQPVAAPRQLDPVLIRDVANSFNTTHYHYTVLFDGHPALNWLSPLDPRAKHRTMGINRVARVGNWLLLTNEFTQWSGSFERTAMPVLFCYGDPGVGKTYLRY